MTCTLCNEEIQSGIRVTRFIPNPDGLPFRPKVVETDFYTTEALVENRHQSCHIQFRVSQPNFRGM